MYQKVLGRLFGLPSVASIRVSRRMSSFPFGGIDEMGTGIVLAYAQSGALPAVAPSNASQPPAAPPAPVPTVTEVPAPSSHAIGSFPPDEDPSVFLALVRALEGAGISHTVTIHTPVRTSEEAAAVRGATLASGAKSMLIDKGTDKAPRYCLAVMSASRKVSWKLLKGLLGKQVGLADGVPTLTGCVPGAVPPFGSLFPCKPQVLLDPSLREQGDTMNFNAGLRTHSVSMRVEDYIASEKPTVEPFTTP